MSASCSGLITKCPNIPCRLIMKAIEAGPLGVCCVQMDIGNGDRVALKKLTRFTRIRPSVKNCDY